MQYKVPQNIDMADRIVGPLTLVQFLYLLVGGIIIYFLFNTIAPVNLTGFVALAIPIAFVCFALAFLKIQDQPFPRFVRAFFIYVGKPKMRVWHKEGHDASLVITPDVQTKNQEVSHKTIKKSQLEHLIQVLDTGGTVKQQPVTKAAPAHRSPSSTLRGRPNMDNVRKTNG